MLERICEIRVYEDHIIFMRRYCPVELNASNILNQEGSKSKWRTMNFKIHENLSQFQNFEI